MAKKSAKASTKKESSTANYEKHVADEPVATVGNGKRRGLTFLGKLGIFLGFPLFCGFMGLYMWYFASLKDPQRKVDLDRDFIMPFLLGLAMVVVVGIQTNGFSTRETKPLVQWPKVKRVRKFVRKGEEGETTESSALPKKEN
jgi:hypothetical protein